METYTGFRVSLRAFRTALEEQVQDLRLLADPARYTLDFYYDTSDVRRAALGVLAFYTPAQKDPRTLAPYEAPWKTDTFNRRRTLVQALLTSGLLGEFGLLPPHQSEFLDQLKTGFGSGVRQSPRQLNAGFLREVGIRGPGTGEDFSLADMTRDQLAAFVKQLAPDSEKFFKAVHFINAGWFERIAHWRTKKLLEARAPDPPIDYGEILHLEPFETLKSSFDRQRPGRSINNFTDAAAVCTLIELTRRCRDGESTSIPRFFISSEYFRVAIEEAGVEKDLVFTTPSGIPVTVLRDPEYYVLRASFFSPLSPHHGRSPDDLQREFNVLHEAAAEYLPEDEASYGAIPEIAPQDERYRELLHRLHRYSFIENVWLPTLAVDDLRAALDQLDDDARRLSDPLLSQHVREEYQKTKEDFTRQSRPYRRAFELMAGLKRFADHAPASLREAAAMEQDLYAHFGLFRFSLPRETHDEIQRLLRLLLSEDVQDRSQAFQDIYEIYSGAVCAGRRDHELTVAAAVLWVAGLDQLIDEMLDDEGARAAPPLRAIHAAVALRRRNEHRARADMEVLEEQLKSAVAEDRPRLSVALAYLNFHLWENLYGGRHWELDGEMTTNGMDQLYAQVAIEHATRAYHALVQLPPVEPGDDIGDDDRRVTERRTLEAYALNLCLFYMLESQPRLDVKQANRYAQMLMKFEQIPGCWQFRFDDTLARFYRRLARTERRASQRKKLLGNAAEYVARAMATAHGDFYVHNLERSLDLDLSAVESELTEAAF